MYNTNYPMTSNIGNKSNFSLPISPPNNFSVVNKPGIIYPMEISNLNNPLEISNTTNNMEITNTTNNPISSKLTIYSKSGHIVQKYNDNPKLITLPKSVKISSILILDSNGNIIPFTYIPETNLSVALTDRSTGEKVEANVIKSDKISKGKILSFDSNNVTLMKDDQIINIREYDYITVGISDDFTRPRLLLNNISQSFTLSYLLSNISWNCIGTALIDNTKNLMYLRLAGIINNNTESDISADTILVSGDVYQNNSSESSMYKSRAVFAASSAPISNPQVETSMLEDYKKYKVGNRLIHNKDVSELGTSTFPIIKLYIHNTTDDNIVRFGYRFTAKDFIPSSSINVYSINKDNDIDGYLGSNEIEQSQNGDEIDIILGESTMLQCKSSIIISDVEVDNDTAHKYNLPTIRDKSWHITTEDLKVDIINHNTSPSSLVLKHYVGNKKLVDLRCQQYKDRKNGFIEWYFQVPPMSDSKPRRENFTCQVLTASYY